MNACQNILCIIDPDARGEEVLRQAAAHARRCGARLIAAHVVDPLIGFDSGRAPFMSPVEMNAELARAARERIRAMLDRIEPEAAVAVEVGVPRPSVIELAVNSKVELVIVGAHSPFGLATCQANTAPEHVPFDVLTVQVRRSWNPLAWFRNSAPRIKPPGRAAMSV